MTDLRELELDESIGIILESCASDPRRFNHMLGLKLKDCSREEGYAEFYLDVQEWCRNPYGDVHGGVTAGVFDASLGICAAALSGYRVTTTDMSVSYLRAMGGERYIIRVEFTQVGRRMVRCNGKAIDEKTGKICATAMASFMVFDVKA